MYADEHEPAREALQRAHAVGVARGDEPAQTNALLFLAELECRAGEWSRADEYAEELLQAGEQRGLEFQGGSALWIRGLVDAYLGRLDQARARATEGVARSREEDEQAFLERNLALLGLIDLSTGDYPAAAERLAPVVRRRQERGAGEPSLYPARELAIEALVAVGDLDEARVQLEWLEEAGRRLGTPWPLAMGARCRGLLAGGRGRPRSGARKLRAGAGGARADAGAVRARPHAADLRHDPSPGQAAERRRGRRSRRRSRSSRRCRRRSGPTTRAPSLPGSAAVRPRATG